MSVRYVGGKSLPGGLWGKLSDLLCDSFDGSSALDAFIREKLGRQVVNGVSWSQALGYVCNDIVSYCDRNGKVAALVTALREERPDDTKLLALIDELVKAGCISEATSA
jgi:hypothetical protein